MFSVRTLRDVGLFTFDWNSKINIAITNILPDCDATVTISHFSEDFWQTPNYPQDYPEDIVCTLTIIVSSVKDFYGLEKY